MSITFVLSDFVGCFVRKNEGYWDGLIVGFAITTPLRLGWCKMPKCLVNWMVCYWVYHIVIPQEINKLKYQLQTILQNAANTFRSLCHYVKPYWWLLMYRATWWLIGGLVNPTFSDYWCIVDIMGSSSQNKWFWRSTKHQCHWLERTWDFAFEQHSWGVRPQQMMATD